MCEEYFKIKIKNEAKCSEKYCVNKQKQNFKNYGRKYLFDGVPVCYKEAYSVKNGGNYERMKGAECTVKGKERGNCENKGNCRHKKPFSCISNTTENGNEHNTAKGIV